MRLTGFAGGALAAAGILAVAVALLLASSNSSDSPPTIPPASLEQTKQQVRSRYLALAQPRAVRGRTTLLRSRLTLRQRDSVYVQTDGTYSPLEGGSAGRVFIEIDGRRVSNESVIDWRSSETPVRHSFNAIGAARLSKGTHEVELVALPIAGAFAVSRSSNLSILVHPAKRVSLARLSRRAGPFNFATSGLGGRGDRLPRAALTSVVADARSPTVALAAGSARRAGENGDAMFGIYLDGRHPGNRSSMWTVNDLCFCAEVQAPLYTQALLRGGSRRSRVSLEATEYPWDQPDVPSEAEDTAAYVVEPSATLVALGGDMHVLGDAKSDRPATRGLTETAWNWSCAVRGVNTGPHCPDIGSNIEIASESFEVPERHSGVVMFAAKARVQAGRHDLGGTVRLWLAVDGKQRGSVGAQELAAPSTIGQRTISASYLTAGRHRLRPGKHRVKVHARVEGSFDSVALSRDLPLIWFD
jgi:hypothetical protein